MKSIKKLTLLLTLIAISMFCLVFTASAEDTWLKLDSRDTVEYKFDEVSGILIIRGEGKIKYNYCDGSSLTPEDMEGDEPAGDESDLEEIKHNAIRKIAGEIKIIIVEYGVETISPYAFSDLKNLEVAILPDSVTEIGYAAFYDCPSLKTVTLPQNLKSIEHHTFSYCESLSSITLPQSLQTISEDSFWCCESLKSISLPTANPLELYCSAFTSSGLEELYIPENITLIGNSIRSCDNLKKITFTNGTCVMSNCNSLEEIVYPIDFSKDFSVAYNCPNLKKVTFPSHKKINNVKIAADSYNKYVSNCPNVTLGNVNYDMVKNAVKVNYEVISTGISVSSLDKVENFKNVQTSTIRSTTNKLTWSPVEGAGYYILYRLDGDKWKKIYSGADTYYSLPTDGDYRVRAVNYDGTKRVYSKYTRLNGVKKIFDPTNTKLTINGSNVKLRWRMPCEVTGFQIYYSTTSYSTGYKKLTNVSTTSYTVKNLTKGKTYHFMVRGYRKNSDGSIHYGGFSYIGMTTIS